mmetsp:Transcript_16729/g.14646  ORF Transcript_16729/g.14646 Transcript_16729/m.14646 type:complete len:214 (-) Transcript_16729:37-678(-)
MEASQPKEEGGNKEEFYQVEKVVGAKTVKGNKVYLIKWVGYSAKDNTWEPIEHLSNVVYMIDEWEENHKNGMGKSKKGGIGPILHGGDKIKKRDGKLIEKAYETKDTMEYDDSAKNEDSEHVQRTNQEWAPEQIGIIESDFKREGMFEKDEPEKIMGVVKQINSKEWLMKVKWKRDSKTGKRAKNSIHTNTDLKRKCPELLFDFYESNVISSI